MQLSNLFIITVILLINQLKLRHTNCAPTRPDEDQTQANGNFSTLRGDIAMRAPAGQHPTNNSSSGAVRLAKQSATNDYWDHRHVFADGVKRALDECREKFKWDRWNCPKKVFQSILDGQEATGSATARSLNDNDKDNENDFDADPVPSNKELGLTRALMASSIVLSTIRSCSQGTSTNKHCHCALAPPTVPKSTTSEDNYHQNRISSRSGDSIQPTTTTTTTTTMTTGIQVQPIEQITPTDPNYDNARTTTTGCDEAVRFGFKIARFYLDNLDGLQSEASRLINAHNYRVGLQAVRKAMKRRCKCMWPSMGANCPMKSCWTVVPDLSEVADHLKRQYRVAAKVGAHTARETDAGHLNKELAAISPEKLVFADASPDYCYENKLLGIQGTLERYCSKPKLNGANNGTEITTTSKYERDSCDRLCTKCGYKIKKVRINVERQCDCRFIYCCSVECKRCPRVEEAYKCVRHS